MCVAQGLRKVKYTQSSSASLSLKVQRKSLTVRGEQLIFIYVYIDKNDSWLPNFCWISQDIFVLML